MFDNNICLTNEEIRNCDGCEYLTDGEVAQLRDFLALYATIIYEAMKNDGERNG